MGLISGTNPTPADPAPSDWNSGFIMGLDLVPDAGASEPTTTTTPTATANSLLAGGMDAPEVDPRAARGGLALIARAFREIGLLKTDVGKLKQ